MLHLAESEGNLTCTKMLDTRSQDECCGNNVLSRFMFVTTNCSKYWDDFDTCRYECLYNNWNLLDSKNKIQRPELYDMITRLYNPLNGYNNYGLAMKRAFEDCDKLYLKYADFVLLYSAQAQNYLRLDKNCEPFALYYAQCVSGNLFMNCPKEYWRDNVMCNEYKTELISCSKYLGLTTVPNDDTLNEPGLKKNGANGHRKRLIDSIMPVILFMFIGFLRNI
ncbi:Odorant-binding protein 50b [Drosophila willistoni]|nr:Odorant-binding protein 50b [Drosophila willistoni]